MDRFQQVLKTIRKNLGGITPSQKLLIGSLAVIMLMTLFLVSQYAAKPTYVPVWPGMPAEDQARAIQALTDAKIKVVNQNGTAVVPQESRQEALAMLQQSGQQPTNSAVVFENILKTQNWINSKEQNRQLYKVMLDNWLGGVLSKFDGVDSAKVFVDAPEQVGFGAGAAKQNVIALVHDQPRHVNGVRHPADACHRADAQIAAIHQPGVHLDRACAGQARTTAGIERGQIFQQHDRRLRGVERGGAQGQHFVAGRDGLANTGRMGSA